MPQAATAVSSYRLSKHGKFRVEHGSYILLCHCKYLQDFRLPLEHLDFLTRLKSPEGIGVDEPLTDIQLDLLADLRATLLLDDAEASSLDRQRSSTLWDRMAYDEDL